MNELIPLIPFKLTNLPQTINKILFIKSDGYVKPGRYITNSPNKIMTENQYDVIDSTNPLFSEIIDNIDNIKYDTDINPLTLNETIFTKFKNDKYLNIDLIYKNTGSIYHDDSTVFDKITHWQNERESDKIISDIYYIAICILDFRFYF
jgi:hypothetical protein